MCNPSGYAQNNHRIKGYVADSAKIAVKDANVILISDKDTLHTTTDQDGYFSFKKVKGGSFSLKVSSIGYHDFTGNYSLNQEIKHIQLKRDARMLKEVVIKGKPNPMRIMQDTIEYNAAAFQVLEGDNMADLLKQLPGLEVDDEYNVTTMGKRMYKLRVNGKDFFTSNVKDFIARLPAEIVAKIQVIDDYGDQANFTGIKIAEPIKLLNIVTKPGMNKGRFGNGGVNGGTNNQFGIGGNLNLWKDTRQSSGELSYNTSNNGAGTAQAMAGGISHADEINKNMRYGINYNLGRNRNAFANEQAIETLNPLGTFYQKNLSTGETWNNNHHFNTNFSYKSKKTFFDGNVMVSYNNSENMSSSVNNQWGVIKQDLENVNRSTNTSPSINAGINFSRILKNKKSSLSGNFGISSSSNHSDQYISTNTRYYDKVTELLVKDSLLNRNLFTDNNNQSFNFGFNYSLGLKKPKDTLARQSLNLSYNLSVGRNTSTVQTYVIDQLSKLPAFVDSLSTDYTSVSVNQTISLGYGYSSNKMRYNFGVSASPTMLSSDDLHLGQKIRSNTLNYSPRINLSKTISKSKTITLNYNGSNRNPNINQLQPVRNTENLQNIVIGNPNLRPSFSHNVNATYNYVAAKTGISLQTGLNFNLTQHEIVTNVVLIPDTLNSLKQETRFENTNGNYRLGSNYALSIPFKKNKYSISWSGGVETSNRAVFINNNKRFSKGINISQQLNTMFTSKKVSAGARVSYRFSSNNNVLNENPIVNVLGQVNGAVFYHTHNYLADLNGSLRFKYLTFNTRMNYSFSTNRGDRVSDNFKNVQRLALSLSAMGRIKKTYYIDIKTSKTINTGYALTNTNPFIVHASLSKRFLKDQSLSFSISANDLLNQGNNLERFISGSSIVDTRTNQATRVFTARLSYNISNFGGKGFRVDPD
ncbi:outer membrane beta-barrel protein [Chitinophaga niabensis]|uniref:outer membrane beta-barrel protein n=1 Tax=Chitinophaga niabensis TaxID=536979 RepID=UPI00094174CB|nr:outer membrane beta-barrel protein [Chitinophaga niabensis]